ncbi:DEAD/DEAH box helicase [Bacteroidales bacterium SW292]|nr:DEAD/DEAH box helicase [Bacteroidales bacterium SW292]
METTDILLRLGIDALTPMQQAMDKAWDTDNDIVLLSPTGTGKTLAFLLPLVRSLSPSAEGVQAVVLTPARELAQQTEQVFRSMGTLYGVMSLHGGRPAMDEHRLMRASQPSVLIATPGRLGDHLRKGNFNANTVETLVIDEFDKCLELGFQEEMEGILKQLPNLRRHILLSATDAEEIPRFVGIGKETTNTVCLDFLSADTSASRLQLYTVASMQKDKLETLFGLLCTLGNTPTLVFANYRESVERIAAFLRDKRFPCGAFHGGMEQEDRERTLYKFRNGTLPVLISTDLAARGLDIEGVENIVHYHLPASADAFTHRNGRTARWEATGNAYLIIGPEEHLPEYLPQVPSGFRLPNPLPALPRPQWTTLYIGKGKKDKLSRADIVGFLYKKGGLGRDDVGRVDVLPHFALAAVRRDRLRQVLQLTQGEKIKGIKTRIEEAK